MSLMIRVLDELEKRKNPHASLRETAMNDESLQQAARFRDKNENKKQWMLGALIAFPVMLALISLFSHHESEYDGVSMQAKNAADRENHFPLSSPENKSKIENVSSASLKKEGKSVAKMKPSEDAIVAKSLMTSAKVITQDILHPKTSVDWNQLLNTPLKVMAHAQQDPNQALLTQTIFDNYGDTVRMHLCFNRLVEHHLQRLNGENVLRIVFEKAALKEALPPFKHEQIPIRGLHALSRDGDLQLEIVLEPNTIVQTAMTQNRNRSEFVMDFSRDMSDRVSLSEDQPRSMPKLPPLPEAKKSAPILEESSILAAVSETPMSEKKESYLKVEPHKVRSSVVEQAADFRYEAARDALLSEKLGTAEKLLKENITVFPKHTPSVLALAELEERQGRGSEALGLLKNYFLQNPANTQITKALARILVKQNAVEEALNMLEVDPPSFMQDPDYHAFLASLYQRLGDNDAAIRAYRKLLQIEPNRATYWMGLGISQEADKQHKDALQSFMRAKSEEGLTRDSLLYINQRIKDLSRSD